METLPRPPEALAKSIDHFFKLASESLLAGSQYKYQTKSGAPSKSAVLEIFSGDFKGKLSCWRNATDRKGSPRNQLNRTDDLIAIFSNNENRLFQGKRPLVPARQRSEYIELYHFFKTQHGHQCSKIIRDLSTYRDAVIFYYSQRHVSANSDSNTPDLQPDKSVDVQKITIDSAPSLEFGKAVVTYAKYLRSQRRNNAVIDLRGKLTHLLHLLGLSSEREAVGRLALESTFITNDAVSRSEILIDDLGWAIFLQGRSEEAKENIISAINILSECPVDSLDARVRAQRATAKGYRHLSFISESPAERDGYLADCEEISKKMRADKAASELYLSAIISDEAQLLHARSFLAAQEIGIQHSGLIAHESFNTLASAKSALSLAEQAANAFAQVGDMERQIKTLVLVERLYEALGNRLKSTQIRTQRDDLLARSGIDGGLSSIAMQRQ